MARVYFDMGREAAKRERDWLFWRTDWTSFDAPQPCTCSARQDSNPWRDMKPFFWLMAVK